MELSLQFGYGMMEHCKSLIQRWGGGKVILSPRDLTHDQLERLSKSVNNLGGESLLDPQFYLPHADHERLCSHDYWPASYSTGTFFQGNELTRLVSSLVSLNKLLGCRKMILPGLLASTISDDWINVQQIFRGEAKRILQGQLELCPTIALSSEVLRNEDQVGALLEDLESQERTTYYLVCEHPNGNYLVDDPVWLANVLDVIAGIKLLGSEVILGYSNHQMLASAAAKATAIASGTWMNVRVFPPEKFSAALEEEVKQRSTWYYSPNSLSEYKIPFLAIAQKMGVLNDLMPPPNMVSEHVKPLFTGANVSAVGLAEGAAFRHYLICVQAQAAQSVKASFDDTLKAQYDMLDNAEKVLKSLHSKGVSGQQRDFRDFIDVNRAALGVLESTRGPLLRRQWVNI